MTVDTQEMSDIAKKYANDVRNVMPVDRAILFGSYAKGTAGGHSDIDVCFFLPSFNGKRRVDIIYELLKISDILYKGMYFEPIVFPSSEIERGNPFVQEVLKTGIDI